VDADAYLLALQGLERTFQHPQVFEAESINLRDEIRAVYQCIHLRLRWSGCVHGSDCTSSLRHEERARR
jgi:hypothetical protein